MLVRRGIVLVTLALAGCGGATRVGAADPDAHVLTLMNPIGDTQEITIYAQEVARRSKGKLRIRIVRSPHQGKIGYEAAVIDDVRAGRSDLAWAGSRRMEGQPAHAQRAAADRQLRRSNGGCWRTTSSHRCWTSSSRSASRASACCRGRCAGRSGCTAA